MTSPITANQGQKMTRMPRVGDLLWHPETSYQYEVLALVLEAREGNDGFFHVENLILNDGGEGDGSKFTKFTWNLLSPPERWYLLAEL